MTPSAKAATSLAWAALETPRPTQTGRVRPGSTAARVRRTRSAACSPTDSRVPVTPMREAA